jgi:hypothetical protein
MKKRKMTEELANQLEQEVSDDADLWTQEPVTIEARPARTSVLSLRLPTKEFHTLLRAARAAGESVSQYVRTAIAMRQANEPVTATINITSGSEETEIPIYPSFYTAGTPQAQPKVMSSTK